MPWTESGLQAIRAYPDLIERLAARAMLCALSGALPPSRAGKTPSIFAAERSLIAERDAFASWIGTAGQAVFRNRDSVQARGEGAGTDFEA